MRLRQRYDTIGETNNIENMLGNMLTDCMKKNIILLQIQQIVV